MCFYFGSYLHLPSGLSLYSMKFYSSEVRKHSRMIYLGSLRFQISNKTFLKSVTFFVKKLPSLKMRFNLLIYKPFIPDTFLDFEVSFILTIYFNINLLDLMILTNTVTWEIIFFLWVLY